MAGRSSTTNWRGAPRLVLALLALTCLAAEPAAAARRLHLEVAQIDYAGARATDVAALLQFEARNPVVQAAAGRISLPAPIGELWHVTASCPTLEVQGDALACDPGHLSGRLGTLGGQRMNVALRGSPAQSRYSLRFDNLSLAGGSANLQLTVAGTRAQAAIRVDRAAIEGLVHLAGYVRSLPEGMTLSGHIGAQLDMAMDARGLMHLEGNLQLYAAGYAAADGRNAAEGLTGVLQWHASRPASAQQWKIAGDAKLTGGAVYSEPVYLDFGPHQLQFVVHGRADIGHHRVHLEHFTLGHAGIARLTGTGEIDLAAAVPVQQLRLELADLDMATAAPAYLQPVLMTTDFKDLQALGHVRGQIDVDQGSMSRVDLNFDQVTLDSTTGALSLDGLSGRLSWVDEDLRRDLALAGDSSRFYSRLRFAAARMWGIEIGAAELPFTTSGRHFRMLDPVFLPIFDGGLAVQTLRIRHAGTPKQYVRFDAELRPISLGLITSAIGLPRFDGTLAGSIPGIELHGDTVTTRGNLEMRAFDGRVTVRDLRLKDPLGQYPQLFASIDVDRLDLAQLTSTFSFGMITGRISGRVQELETFSWMPVALDARFFTTPGDRTPRRISQRAVANLSRIGGGSGGSVSGALQSGFLRFFKQFHYRRLGLSCRLRNDVCEMGGVAPAGDGYYIVQGSGLPRINVIGSQRRVAWSRLVRQLQAISTSGGPVVR